MDTVAQDWNHRSVTAPPRRFTITFAGTPTADDLADVPTFDMRDSGQRAALRDAILEPFGKPETPASNDSCDASPATSNIALLIEVKACEGNPGLYIASAEGHSQFGTGETPYDALREFFADMADHMAFLERHERVLAKGLANELGYLRTFAGNGRI